jgi:D-3-phosphoglycerate dehydrogenase / 2-oxoglutarate reductase
MSKGTILITDSLFIFKEHEDMLREGGYEIERLDVPKASEEQLVAAIKGKVGYILGGIEELTEPVVAAADSLRAIIFTGSDWRHFIPAHEVATARGIAIANAPGANSYAVAEYTIALMLGMVRNIFDLGRAGTNKFSTTSSLQNSTVGIVGMGKIGSRVAQMLHGLGVKELLYTSTHPHREIETATGAKFVTLETLLQQSDIVTTHTPKHSGRLLGEAELLKLRDGALIINCGSDATIDDAALLNELASGRLRAAMDHNPGGEFEKLALSNWYCSNESAAYNTRSANKIASDMAVTSIRNLLEIGKDQYKVN